MPISPKQPPATGPAACDGGRTIGAVTIPKLAIRLHGGLAPRRCVELAVAAETHGFSSVWFAENPFGRGVLPAASACAAATARLRIGIGVFNPFNRHPTLMAMEIGALDELSRGRAALGIGAGIAAQVERMGFGYDRPIGAVRDAFAIVRGLLRGETVTHEGRDFSATDVKLDFTPLRSDLPLFMAARGDQSLRLCGEVADGLMISNMCNPAFTAAAVGKIRASARAKGREAPFEVVQYVPCAVSDDADAAIRMAKDMVAAMLPVYWTLGDRFAPARAALARGSGISEAEFSAAVEELRIGTPAAEALDDRFIAAFALAGTPAQCIEQAAIYRDAGVTEIALAFGGAQPEVAIAALGKLIAGLTPTGRTQPPRRPSRRGL